MSAGEHSAQPGTGDPKLLEMLIGHELGGFRIDEPIGAGGMGTVFRGTQLSIGRTVAVKVVREHAVPNGAERFLREARVISQIDHPNVVQLIDFGHDPDRGLMYYAMEHIDGVPLNELTRGGRLHPNLVIELAMQACSALAQTHAAGVIHRDLKSSNMLVSVSADGAVRLRILDFGIAASFEDTADLTKTGVLCGTPAYIAPEQARGEEPTALMDIYALGVNVHRMLAGQSPFSGGNAISLVMKHIQDAPPDLSVYAQRKLIPKSLVALADELLAKRPEDRPASAGETRRRLGVIRQELGWEAVEIRPPEVATLMSSWKRAPVARESGELPDWWQIPNDDDGPTEPLDATEVERRASTSSGPIGGRSGGGWSAFNQTPAAKSGPHQAMVLDPVTGEYMAVGPGDASPPPTEPKRQAASAMALDVDNPRGRRFSTDELQVDLPLRPTQPAAEPVEPQTEGPDVLKLVGIMLVVCIGMLGLLLLVTSDSDAPPPPAPEEIDAVVGTRTEPEPVKDVKKKKPVVKPAKQEPEVEVIELFEDDDIGDTPRKGPIIIEEGEE